MIIVEGPDGSGKSTLVDQLTNEFDFDFLPGPKASSICPSLQFKDHDLERFIDDDIAKWTESGYGPRIYDRHSLISEPIYGPIRRGRVGIEFLSPWFTSRTKLLHKMCLMVWCEPGWDAVLEAVEKNPSLQPEDVRDKLRAIWLQYKLTARTYGGKHVIYNRNKPASLLRTVDMVNDHVEGWLF